MPCGQSSTRARTSRGRRRSSSTAPSGSPRPIASAEMVKFTKDGSTATSAALKLARAATGRDLVAICADHPFFSYDDWFIVTTTLDGRDPRRRGDDDDGLPLQRPRQRGARCSPSIPGGSPPCSSSRCAPSRRQPGFLEGVRELCTEHGAVLVFDEMITGFRYDRHGAQHLYGVTPGPLDVRQGAGQRLLAVRARAVAAT